MAIPARKDGQPLDLLSSFNLWVEMIYLEYIIDFIKQFYLYYFILFEHEQEAIQENRVIHDDHQKILQDILKE